eukprot:1281109-Prymnesium_polylepis.1
MCDGELDSALRFVHFAAHTDRAQRAELARVLIACKADVNHRRPQDGWSVLMEATIHGDAEIARELIEAGADVNWVASHGPNDRGPVTALDVAERTRLGALTAQLEACGARPSGSVQMVEESSTETIDSWLSVDVGAAYDSERKILNLQGMDLPVPVVREELARALSSGHVKWVLARFGIDEIDVETATALVAALQADTCLVNHIDLRNCPCTSEKA